MKADHGLCTWRPLVGAAMVGALAIAVSVQGSPRVGGERDKGSGKSQASRVVTGPSAHINSAIAVGATATITLKPVAPKTVPASSYNGSITGNKLTLNAVPARAWFEMQATGWAPQGLKTSQIKLDGLTGYLGSNAICGGAAASGGDLFPATQSCAANTDCRSTISGLAAACGSGEPSKCVPRPGYYPAGGNICEPTFQDKCDPEFVLAGIAGVAACDTSTLNHRCGSTTEGDPSPDAGPSYFGTVVLDVPATAKGLYTIGYTVNDTFLQDITLPVALDIPIAALNPGQVEIVCGSCCTNLGPSTSLCTDGVTLTECNALQTTNTRVFRANTSCAEQACPACITNADCNDNDRCTQDICAAFVCSNPPVATWDPANECCNAADGTEDAIVSPDQCVAANCSLPGNRGDLVLSDRTGLGCNDENPCTFADTCANGAGSCAGLNAGTVACTPTGGECLAATGVDYPCVDGFCFCTLTPDLTVEIDPGGKSLLPGGSIFDPDCYGNDKITGTVRVGASSSPVNGAQIALTYDPTCLDFNGIAGVAPFTFDVYGPVVDEAAGTIFYAVGVAFGAGNGPNGNADILAFSFTKIGNCNSCEICFTDVNPMHTYLTDDAGQRITVVGHCSKTIKANNTVVLTVPDTITTNVDCDWPTAVENWPAPSATDSCGTSQVFCRGEHDSGIVWDSARVTGGGEFPIGASSFCCYAVSDYCGKIVGCPPNTDCELDPNQPNKSGVGHTPFGCWTVQVNDETSLDITIGLSPTAQSKPGDSLTRCIKFTLFTNCTQEPLVFSDDVTFGGIFEFIGKSTGKVKIPGSGQWDCITAQDQMHTLRSCYTFGPNDCVGGQLNASFSGDPRLGGNWLIGGNLDGWKKDDPTANPSLDVIDILDYGTFVSQYLRNYGFTDTPCGTPGPNADINGDGVVDLDDYAFVSMNFLTSSKQCCCGPQTASVNAITEISVAQLRAEGLGDLAVADLNGDGLLNLADMAAFDQGVRPSKTVPTKGGTRSSGSR